MLRRELNRPAMVDRRGGNAISRIERIDERCRGAQGREALDPPDVALIDGNEHELSRVRAFVGREVVDGCSASQRPRARRHELGRDYLARLTVDLDLELVGGKTPEGITIAIDYRHIDSDELDP